MTSLDYPHRARREPMEALLAELGGAERTAPRQGRPALSAFIIARDEEMRIGRTLRALREIADDIVVVDSGSTDQTVAIAEAHGARVLFRAWQGYGNQKRFAEEQCRHRWVLNVDADEVLTPGLIAEIGALLQNKPEPGAYNIRILNVYPGDAAPRPLADDYNVVRLYHRDVASYRDHPSHDRVELKGVRPGQITAPIWHFPVVNWHASIEKLNRFSSFQATLPSRRDARMLKLRIFSEFPINFFKTYILRRHFTGGWKGFYFAVGQAFMRTSRIAKMLETQEGVTYRPPPRPRERHERPPHLSQYRP
jgi:glycosyltransferase involved in cell wall biosynthesis